MTALKGQKTVLIVEDLPSLREAVASEFEFLNWRTVVAENGADALEKWKAEPTLDLIVSDIRMPVCDGPQFLDALRKISVQDPPFIFMTGFSDLKTYDALDRGADMIIGKPLNPDLLPLAIAELETPLIQRWKNVPGGAIHATLECKLPLRDDVSLQFGRSGFFVANQTFSLPDTLLVNNVVQFTMDCPLIPSSRLAGHGKIIWSRQNDAEGLLNGHGIQFLYLEEPGRSEYIHLIGAMGMCSTIPRGKTQGHK